MTRISKMHSGCFAAHDTSVSSRAYEFRKPKGMTKAYLDAVVGSVSNPSRRWSEKKARHSLILGHQGAQKQVLAAHSSAEDETPLAVSLTFRLFQRASWDSCLLRSCGRLRKRQRGFPSLQTHLRHLEASPSTEDAGALLCRLIPFAVSLDRDTPGFWLPALRQQLESVKSLLCFCGGQSCFCQNSQSLWALEC